jgi:predicted ATP-grasp superfamily ATP-dependent carboligase
MALTAFGDRIRAVFQKNQGASAARNAAMRLAQGSWLAYLDDDDVWKEDKIKKQNELIRRSPGLGLVYCSDYAVDHELRVMYERPAKEENRGDVFERLLVNNFIFTSCVLARRDAVEQAGFMDLRLKFAQDWDLWLKIAAKFPVDFVGAPLVYYRHSPVGCLTKDIPAISRMGEMQDIVDRAARYRAISKGSRDSAYYNLGCRWASTWLQVGQRQKAFGSALQAVSHKPFSWEGYRLAIHSMVPPSIKDITKSLLGRNGSTSNQVPSVAGTQASAHKSDSPNATSAERRETVATLAPFPQEKPPVIILNIYYSGLAIARDLAGQGMRAIGLSATRKNYGSFTRSCKVHASPDSQEQPEMLKEFLLQHSTKWAGAIIFPTRDADVLFLDRYREELGQHFRLGIPPRECLLSVVDKNNLVAAAKRANVPVPRTMVVGSPADLGRIGSEVGFPCVVKPVSSAHWRQADDWKKVGWRKAFLVNREDELLTEYARVCKVHPKVLVQEWIPGRTEDIVIFGGYVDEASEPVAYFTARKLIQSPDDFGTGCLVESVDISALLEPTKRLLRATGYHGMAEVEYKWDVRTKEFKLIEINTRHWDWFQLGHASGVNLTWAAYNDLIGNPIRLVQPPIVKAKWIAEPELFYYVLRGLYRNELKLGELFHKLAGRRMYGILNWRDLLPTLYYWFCELPPRLWRQMRDSQNRKEKLP